MKADEQTYRLYSCERCAEQVRICRDCDRGNRYCAGECAQIRRRESRHRAGTRYQLGYRGALRHAARQSAWRERQVQKVTHQGSLHPALPATVVSTLTQTTTEGTHADIAAIEPPCAHRAADARLPTRWPVLRQAAATPRCCFCGRVLSRFARLGPLRGGP